VSAAAQAQIATHSPSIAKASGAFYTPAPLAAALAGWAIRAGSRQIFDPSVGEGALLEASADRLTELGVHDPRARIWGAELNEASLATAASQLRGRVDPKHLLRGDFFSLTPSDFCDTFDAIISNPPYIRHHLLKGEVRARARRCAERGGVELPDRADSWAYFVAHLLGFLSDDGRMGLLLPGSALHAGYADPVLSAVEKLGGVSRLIRVREPLFPGVQERTVVLLVDRNRRAAQMDYREAKDLDALRYLLDPDAQSTRRGHPRAADPEERFRHLLSPPARNLWCELIERPEVSRLGELARLRIGVVTGANSFFVRTAEQARWLGGGERRWPAIVTRSKWLRGPTWTQTDIERLAGKPSRLMVIEPGSYIGARLREEIDAAENDGLDQRSHCRGREPWYALSDRASPDLFLPYMGATAPRLVVNVARHTCTNAIHRAYLKPGAPSAASLAASSFTSLYRLSAELAGRHYGGGVLKLELGEAGQLRTIDVPGAADHLGELSARLGSRGMPAAIAYADRVFLQDWLGLTSREVRLLRTQAVYLERRRAPH